jgi:hypothetical protein
MDPIKKPVIDLLKQDLQYLWILCGHELTGPSCRILLSRLIVFKLCVIGGHSFENLPLEYSPHNPERVTSYLCQWIDLPDDHSRLKSLTDYIPHVEDFSRLEPVMVPHDTLFDSTLRVLRFNNINYVNYNQYISSAGLWNVVCDQLNFSGCKFALINAVLIVYNICKPDIPINDYCQFDNYIYAISSDFDKFEQLLTLISNIIGINILYHVVTGTSMSRKFITTFPTSHRYIMVTQIINISKNGYEINYLSLRNEHMDVINYNNYPIVSEYQTRQAIQRGTWCSNTYHIPELTCKPIDIHVSKIPNDIKDRSILTASPSLTTPLPTITPIKSISPEDWRLMHQRHNMRALIETSVGTLTMVAGVLFIASLFV